ncbi:hypothetical protein CCR97_09645 [Rhodoplanes elegans]|uniref:Uncharacterized protein n=1 Tax=Rhodoplanes elegans TaxID=29408 RepID=A0A327KWD0_9BRAD|nr:hypothetical protein [Rhodoplanes elegans]RAI39678.1 hypothetical protein CH338_08670 [Rhodoplanes elegans]
MRQVPSTERPPIVGTGLPRSERFVRRSAATSSRVSAVGRGFGTRLMELGKDTASGSVARPAVTAPGPRRPTPPARS